MLAVILVFSASALCSCSRDSAYDPARNRKLVITLFSPGGLGDRGYNDQILYGLQTVYNTRPDCSMLFQSPSSMEEAQEIFSQWLTGSPDGTRSLFILASAEYEPLLELINSLEGVDMTGKSVMIFESRTTFSHPSVYSARISMFGASYLAGITVAAMGFSHPLVLLGSETDVPIRAASNGFRDGYESYPGVGKVDVRYVSEDWHGFNMAQHVYEMMPELSEKYDFIFPVAGGTNLGIYRYLRETPDGPLVAGMDIDQSPFSNNIVGSVVKNIDRMLEQGITAWLDNHKRSKQHDMFGLDSGFVDWQLSSLYLDYSQVVRYYRVSAMQREAEYGDR